jgi:hypothetical protein
VRPAHVHIRQGRQIERQTCSLVSYPLARVDATDARRFPECTDTASKDAEFNRRPPRAGAEHAIKAFVRLRNIFGGTSTVKGLREYLVLLSISETCKCKGVSILDFLLSGDVDVDAFFRKR